MSVLVVRKEGEHVRIKVGSVEILVVIQEIYDGEVTMLIDSPSGVRVKSARDVKN